MVSPVVFESYLSGKVILIVIGAGLIAGGALYGADTIGSDDVITPPKDGSMDPGLYVDSAFCQVVEGESDKLHIGLQSRGDVEVRQAIEVSVYRENETDLPIMEFLGVGWNKVEKAVADKNRMVTIDTSSSLIETEFEEGRSYWIDVYLPKTVETLNCKAQTEIKTNNKEDTNEQQNTANDTRTEPENRSEKEETWENDRVPPTTSIRYNTAGWQPTPQNVTISCADDENGSGCWSIEWKLFDASGNLLQHKIVYNNQTFLHIGTDKDGLLELRYRGRDNAATIESWNHRAIRIDKNQPMIGITSDEAWYGSDFTRFVADEAGGPSGLSSCEYRIKDGSGDWSSWMERSCRSVTVSVGKELSNECVTEGTDMCQIEVRVWSRAGLNATDTATFDVDFTAPATQIIAPDSNTVFEENFRITVDDGSSSGFSSCSYRITDSTQGSTDWTARGCSDGGFNVSVGQYETCTTEGDGTCIVETRVTDNAGKTSLDQAAYSINYTTDTTSGETNSTEETNTTNTSTNTTEETNSTNSTNATNSTNNTTEELDGYTYTISSDSDWEQGTFDGTTVLQDTLQIGYRDNGDRVGYWRFDEGSGTVIDYSGTGNDGRTENGVNRDVAGLFGTPAFSFDGVDDYVEIPDDPSLDTDIDTLTVSLWFAFNTDSADGIERILVKQRSGSAVYSVKRDWDDQMAFAGGGFSAATPFRARDKNWHHFTGVLTSTATKIYIDGVLENERDGGDLLDGNKPLYIGGDFFSDDHYSPARIDEIQIYDRALSASEVKDLYFNGVPFIGEYEHMVDTGVVNNWSTIFVDAAVPQETGVEATFEAVDSSGNVVDAQSFTVSDGAANYSLSIQDSEDARFVFSGSSNDPEQTWTVDKVTAYYNR